jgi:glycosyltransferase involved in cell wall biosynthesis
MFEIIVVDHRSTDNTPTVIKQLATEPGVPLRYILEEHPGVSFARNRGAEEASNPYLAYLDDDCSVGPDWLRRLASGFDLNERVVAVGGQVILQWEAPKPSWFGPELERWFAVNGHLGQQPRLLTAFEYIVEGNMGIERRAWKAGGGFLGMEQFGSRGMAAGEILYLLQKLHQQRGKIAFVPQAIAVHHVRPSTQRRMVLRAYWQGVSDGLLDYLIYRRSWLSTAGRLVLDASAMIVLFGYTCFSYLKADQAKGIFHLMRAIRRLSLVLSEMRLIGDWPRIRVWASAHHPIK